jgi:hypothetical protein
MLKIEKMIEEIRARFLTEATEFYHGPVPERLLDRLSWHFAAGAGLDRDGLVRRVRDDHAAFVAEYADEGPVWDPDEVVLNAGRALVMYMVRRAGADETQFGMADLRSPDGHRFSAGELLWALYQATAADVLAGPHGVFEGLELVTAFGTGRDTLPVWVPVYRMHLGS